MSRTIAAMTPASKLSPSASRDRSRGEQEACQRIRKLPDCDPKVARPIGAAKHVRAEAVEPVCRLCL